MRGTDWARRPVAVRAALSLVALMMMLGTLGASQAHVTGASSFEDDFEYDNNVPLTSAPSAAYWQISPHVPSGWTVGARPATLNMAALGTMNVLAASQKQGPPLEPIAFVKKPFGNFEVQVQAAWDRSVPPSSGVGVVFRAAIDPVSGLADRNNLYLFTAVAGPTRFYPTGKAFELWKRVAGTYYKMTEHVNTFIDFGNNRLHTYKVSMSGTRIMAWVDGLMVFNVVDSPGDDGNGVGNVYKAPGPAFASGAVGLRTSGTQALFDDLVVVGDPGYEGRATALNVYGKTGYHAVVGSAAGPGAEQGAAAGDSGFRYEDHDYSADVNALSLPDLENGSLGAAVFHVEGTAGTQTSKAQVLGFATTLTDENKRVVVNIAADAIRATGVSSCSGASSTVDVVNLTWQVIYSDANGQPVSQQGSVTQLGAAPNQNLLDPANTTGPLPTIGPYNPNPTLATAPVKIVLHSRQLTTDPHRVEAAALRVTFYANADGNVPNRSTPAIVSIDVAIGDVVAGVICPNI